MASRRLSNDDGGGAESAEDAVNVRVLDRAESRLELEGLLLGDDDEMIIVEGDDDR